MNLSEEKLKELFGVQMPRNRTCENTSHKWAYWPNEIRAALSQLPLVLIHPVDHGRNTHLEIVLRNLDENKCELLDEKGYRLYWAKSDEPRVWTSLLTKELAHKLDELAQIVGQCRILQFEWIVEAQNSANTIMLDVPFEKNQFVRDRGAWWDKSVRTWCITTSKMSDELREFLPPEFS